MKMHIEFDNDKKDIVSDGPFSIHIKGNNPWDDFRFMNFSYFFGRELEVVDSFTAGDKTVEISIRGGDFLEHFAPDYAGELICEIEYNDIHFTITK